MCLCIIINDLVIYNLKNNNNLARVIESETEI